MSKFETLTQQSRREKRREKKKKTPTYTIVMLHPKKKKKWLTSQDTVFASGTSSKMNWPILPALSKVRCFFDTIKRASKALWGILNAFCSPSNYCSIGPSKSLSPLHYWWILRVRYKANWTSVTRSWKGKSKELKIQKWHKIKQDIQRSHGDPSKLQQ